MRADYVLQRGGVGGACSACGKTMSAFDLLSEDLQNALKRLGICTPTQVQQSALPPALKGRDLLATAQTGTGKTFAFLLPLITRLRTAPSSAALVLSPTRELAQQTLDALQSVLPDQKEIPAALIIGGDNIHKQYAALRRKPRIIIGTPGRIIDHIGRKSLSLKNIAFFVLDEADRMLDMGFIPDVRKIFAALPLPRQTLLFSATLPKEIEALADGFLNGPVRVQIGSVTRPADSVVQQIVRLGTRERLGQLLCELETRRGGVLVFVKSKHGADRLAKQLKQYGVKANALHGDLRQNRRRQVMELFRSGAVPVLVATDVAARGIDVADMACVINYDLPQCPEDYIHRIGRTGRAGGAGTALSFVTEDESKWKDICRVCRLGKVTELTKTSRPLPKPKFTPDPPKKKPLRPAAEQPKPAARESVQPPAAKVKPPRPLPQKKAGAAKSSASAAVKTNSPARSAKSAGQAPAVQTPPAAHGFHIMRVGSKKSAAVLEPRRAKPHFSAGKKRGKPKFFKRKKR